MNNLSSEFIPAATQTSGGSTAASTPLGERGLRGLELVLAELGVPDLIIGEVRGDLNLDALRVAATRAQARHPGLRALVDRQGRRPRFIYFEPDARRVDVSEVGSATAGPADRSGPIWQHVAERESMQRFDLEKRFAFRVIWVPGDAGGHVIVSACHAVVDGISLMRLLHELLADASQVTSGRRLPAVVAKSPTPAVLDSIEPQRFDPILGWIGKLVTLRQQKNYAARSVLPIQGRLPKGSTVETCCTFQVGSRAAFAGTRDKCKALGPTVGGLYAAAVEFAALRYVYESTRKLPLKRGKLELPMSMDFSLRPLIAGASKTQAALGLFTGVADVGVRIAPETTLWELARRLSTQAKLQLHRRLPLLFHTALDSIVDLRSELNARGITYEESGGVADGLNISNVGPYPYPTHHEQLELCNVFGLNGALLGGPMLIFWLRTVDEHFCYNAMAASPACDRASAARVFSWVVEIMEATSTSALDHCSIQAYATHAPV